MYLGCGVGEKEEEEKQGMEKTDLSVNGLLLNHSLDRHSSHCCLPTILQAAFTSSQGVPIYR